VRLARSAALPVALALAVVAAKLPTLSTPLYWDEVGYAERGRWLAEGSLLWVLPGFRPAELFEGHPPGLQATLAILSLLFGWSIPLAHLVTLAFAVLAVTFLYLIGRHLYDAATGLLAALLLLLSPLFLAQAGFFLTDLPVMALGVASAYFALRRRFAAYAICAVYMLLIKETALAFMAALLAYLFVTDKRPLRDRLAATALYATPLLAIGLFLGFQKLVTGSFAWIIPDLPGRNTTLVDIRPTAVRSQARRVFDWIFVYQGRFVFSALVLVSLLTLRRWRAHPELLLYGLVLLASGGSFAVVTFLPRYVLPVFPFFYLASAWAVMRLVRARAWRLVAGGTAVAVSVAALVVEPFSENAEFNLRYLDVVATYREAAHAVVSDFPRATVLTTWPFTDVLTRPTLGYLPASVSRAQQVRVLGVDPTSAAPDAGQADLILVAVEPPGPGTEHLRDFARQERWRLVRRFERGEALSELYERPT
jgi:4-amino-4-deoxy-L-arabinose transferase-like glycosyltransferase